MHFYMSTLKYDISSNNKWKMLSKASQEPESIFQVRDEIFESKDVKMHQLIAEFT